MCDGGGWREEPPPHTHQDWKRQRPRGGYEPLSVLHPPPRAGRAQTVPSIEKLLIKIEGLGRRLGKVQRKKSCPVLCPGFDSGK